MSNTKKGKPIQGYISFEESSGLYVGRFTYTDEFKKRHSVRVSAHTRKEANQLLKTRIAQHLSSENDKQEANARFSVVIDEYIEKRLTPAIFVDGKKVAGRKSIKPELAILKTIKHFFQDRRIRDLRPKDLENFKAQRLQVKSWHGRQRKAATVRAEIEVLKRIFRFALRYEYIEKNPYDRLGKEASISIQQLRHRQEFPTFAEELALLRDVEKRETQLKQFLIVAADTGLRSNEILTLEWETDVDFERKRIYLRDINAKTNRGRSVPMTPRVHAALQEIQTDKGRSKKVFGDIQSYYWTFRDARKRLQIDHLHIHDYRRAFTTRCLRIGVPYAVVVKTTGHLTGEWQKYLNLEQDLFGSHVSVTTEEVRAFGLEVLRELEAALNTDKLESLLSTCT